MQLTMMVALTIGLAILLRTRDATVPIMVCVSPFFRRLEMKMFMLPIALATMAVSAVVSAQSPPSANPPSDTTSPPSSSMQTPSTSGSSSYSQSDSAKAKMKDCISKQKAGNSQLSDADAKTACKTEMKNGG
jgi:hypothetical protein